MNEEMVKYVQEIGGEETGLLRVTTKSIIIKIVESKIATIQRLNSQYYFLSVRKGNRGYMGRIGNLNEKPQLNPMDFYPIMTKNEREYKLVRQSNIQSLFDDLSPLLSLLTESEYPLYGIVSLDSVERALVNS
ncbi:TldD/PmbA family protein, partial [Sulfolobus sp. E5]